MQKTKMRVDLFEMKIPDDTLSSWICHGHIQIGGAIDVYDIVFRITGGHFLSKGIKIFDFIPILVTFCFNFSSFLG